MQNKLYQVFSAFSWKKVIYLKTLFILPLLFSAAAHAATCPEPGDLKYNSPDKLYSSPIVDGIFWNSFDTYSAPLNNIKADFAEFRMNERLPEGHKGYGTATCHYSSVSGGNVNIYIDMYPVRSGVPAGNKVFVMPESSTFKPSRFLINGETMSQCQQQGHNTSNCVFKFDGTVSPVKASSASPFGSAAASTCEENYAAAIQRCNAAQNPPLAGCYDQATAAYHMCVGMRPPPNDGSTPVDPINRIP